MFSIILSDLVDKSKKTNCHTPFKKGMCPLDEEEVNPPLKKMKIEVMEPEIEVVEPTPENHAYQNYEILTDYQPVELNATTSRKVLRNQQEKGHS